MALQEKPCATCATPYKRYGTRFCEPCSKARHLYRVFGSGQYLAQLQVAQARRRGDLPAPGTCVDCSAPATDYDHRDYSRPLDVEAVCRGCNLRRKSAAPRPWSFDEFMTWVGAQRRFPRLRRVDPALFERMRRNHFEAP